MELIVPEKPKIFLSSTIKDLVNIRGSIKEVFKQIEIHVYASEYADFPADANKHAFDNCFDKIRKSDLVICIINTDYGHCPDPSGRPPISITRQEIRVANNNRIPVWTFVQDKTQTQRDQFNNLTEREGASVATELLFKNFKHYTCSKVESKEVFGFIDEINRLNIDNWIFSYKTAADLLATIHLQFENFLKEYYNNFPFVNYMDVFETSKTFQKILSHNREFNNYHEKLVSIKKGLPESRQLWKNKGIIELNEVSSVMMRKFLDNFLYSSADKAIAKKTMYITDTTMETIKPDVWEKSRFHRRILESTHQVVRKNNFTVYSYCRILILINPYNALKDIVWIKNLDFLISFHLNSKKIWV